MPVTTSKLHPPEDPPFPAAQLAPVVDRDGVILREPLVSSGGWVDPDGKIILGLRKVSSLVNLSKRNSLITADHVTAGDRFARVYELANHFGVRGRDYGSPQGGSGGGGGPLPIQVRAVTRLRSIERSIGSRALPILVAVTVNNMTLQEWSSVKRINPSVALGQLHAILERLVEHFLSE